MRTTIAVFCIFASCVLTCSTGSNAFGQDRAETEEACFFATGGAPREHKLCRDDPLQLAKQGLVIDAIRALGLPAPRIKFKVCAETSFSAASVGPDAGRRSYIVYYPDTDANIDQLLVPVLHELSHIYQIQAAGSPAGLLGQYPLKQIELGADFLAGVISASYLNDVSANRFAESMQLLGRYWDYSEDSHGSPRERAKAYRNGYFLKRTEFQGSLATAYSIFDEERYARIEDPE